MPNFLKVNSWNTFVDKLKTADNKPKDGKINLNPSATLDSGRIDPKQLSKNNDDTLSPEYRGAIQTIEKSFNFKSQENLIVSVSPATLISKGSLASLILIESLDQLDGHDQAVSLATLETLKTKDGRSKLKEILKDHYQEYEKGMKPEAKEDLLQLIKLLMQ